MVAGKERRKGRIRWKEPAEAGQAQGSLERSRLPSTRTSLMPKGTEPTHLS